MEEILHQCFRLPNGEEEGTWFTCKQVSEALMKVYPSMKRGKATNIRIGHAEVSGLPDEAHKNWGMI